MTQVKSKWEIIFYNLEDRRVKQKPNIQLGDLVKTSDIRKVFCKRDSTNFSYEDYTITEVRHDTNPSYRINYFPARYNKNLILPTKLSLEQNNQVMKKQNLIQQNNKK